MRKTVWGRQFVNSNINKRLLPVLDITITIQKPCRAFLSSSQAAFIITADAVRKDTRGIWDCIFSLEFIQAMFEKSDIAGRIIDHLLT